MAFDVLSYTASKKYTDETVLGVGGLKGAPATIKSVVHENGRNIVTFEWTANDGTTRETKMYVDDGTPIYVWTSGKTYKYGDLAIYNSCFYRCIVENHDIEFDDRKWNEIGSPDGNYDIVQSSELLPPRFTPADRKMYYCIEDMCFYLWNGFTWVEQKKKATYDELGMVKINEETLNVSSEGEVSIRPITSNEISSLFNA